MGGERRARARARRSTSAIEAPSPSCRKRAAREFVGVAAGAAGKRVLIVDDNATNRRVLDASARKVGHELARHQSPREALRWLDDGEAFDLAILDMHMPEMDGVTLARDDPRARSPALPLVLVQLARAAGGRATTTRSFAALPREAAPPSQLFDTLVRLLAHDVAAEPAAPAAPRSISEMAARHPLRILLAEDNVVNQKLALRMLQQMGYRADLASNGLEAVESVERQTTMSS